VPSCGISVELETVAVNVKFWPVKDGLGVDTNVTVVDIAVTVCMTVLLTLPFVVVSPE